MKTLTALFLMIALFTGASYAQDNWIRCESIRDGSIQSFRGYNCPAGWVPV